MEKIRSLIDKLIPPDLPTIIKKVSKWTFILFAFMGLLMSFKPRYPIQMIATFIYFLVIASVCALALPTGFRLMMKLMNKTSFADLDARYRKNGYEPVMGQIMRNSNPFGAPRERIIAAYLYLMTENYSAAREQLNAASEATVSSRYAAMESLSRIRLDIMTGKPERAEQTFMQSRLSLDEAYGKKPELLGTYKPYLDDTLVYYVTAGVLSERLGMHEEVGKYRDLAEFQLQKRGTVAEGELLMAIFELNLLYAQGRLEEADSYFRQLRGEISTASVLPPGRQEDIIRLLEQARLYANIAAATTTAIDITKERALPHAIDETVAFSSEHGDNPDEMASIPFL